ncbi:Recombination protein RecR [Olavius algarvensis spirochete endosymbiont]|uniref:recombination mediator RecR n=1 Tax=Olavius algarvensis spirochete endosymbiont TaxID=260710 RepID=UPI000F2D5472|nr:recombination mediator RecR [Olavius algarvensis spirochete endosymbiont]CAD7845708.1 MAG: Recombination protein RecR [Olavius algarvensis spirochete endosymbiont]VDB00197.1 Recombination protein RecR [Olavius algarvensis spirochete endosymbiont]
MQRIEQLIVQLSRLPGIGKKSASRISYWLLETDREFVSNLSAQLGELRQNIVRCRECRNYAETELCSICDSFQRERDLMCIVEHPRDIATIESTGEFRGFYYVLHGVLSPLDGVGPEELGLAKLYDRIKKQDIKEVIIATNPTLEGDTTALYITKQLADEGLRVSRIATGIPVGGDMEYADRLSVARALKGRQVIEGLTS